MDIKKVLLQAIVGAATAFSAVVPRVASSGTSVSIENNTPSSWTLGGVRFLNNGWKWERTPDGMVGSWFKSLNEPQADGKNEVSVYFMSNAPADNYRRLTPGQTRSFGHPWGNFPETKEPVAGSEVLLLKTGAPGLPDMPITADPITVDELQRLINEPEFYSETYRPEVYDSLGVRGGRYSGGMMNTWWGETQAQIAIPRETFRISNTELRVDQSQIMFWMGISLAQEYLSIDMQSLMAIGMKETFAGTPSFRESFLNGTEFTPFHVEAPSGIDRAFNYPSFFPHFEERLSSSRDVASSGISPDEFMAYYTRAQSGTTVMNSATTINGSFFPSLFLYANYDVLAYSSDVKWMEALDISREEGDPYLGLSAMVVAYNQGLFGHMGTFAGAFSEASYQESARNLDRYSFGPGNNNYIYDLYDGFVRQFIDASRESLTDPSIELIDFAITRDEMLSVYFGDNGTVENQGDGGILRFFYDPEAQYRDIRQKIWDDVNEAFDLVAGRAPSVDGDNISFRYDFLSLLRIAKADFDFTRNFVIAGDAQILIERNSNPHVNDGDELYPYITEVNSYYDDQNSAQVYEVTVWDDREVDEVRWSIDREWRTWHTVTTAYEEISDQEKRFRFSVGRRTAEALDADQIWIMGTDSWGNSVVHTYPLHFRNPMRVDSVFAIDRTGDGSADQIVAKFYSGSNSDLLYNEISFAWPQSSPIIFPDESDIERDLESSTLRISSDRIGGGYSDGALFNWSYTLRWGDEESEDISLKDVAILDRVGPAVLEANFEMIDGRDRDTLYITLSERVENTRREDHPYLMFRREGSDEFTLLESNYLIPVENSNVFKAIFPIGAFDDYDFVRLVYDRSKDPIVDLANNAPAPYNQWVEINKDGGKLPKFIGASIYDISGDGFGDSVYVALERGSSREAFTLADIKRSESRYSWPRVVPLMDLPEFSEEGEYSFSFKIDGSSGAGRGFISLLFPEDTPPVEGSIDDSVGPALQSAFLDISDSDRDADTLVLRVSESIAFEADNHAYFYFDSEDGDLIKSLSLEPGDEDTLRAIFEKGVIHEKSRVKLRYKSESSPLRDLVGNRPAVNNQWVKLEVYGGREARIVRAEIFDTEGDGFGDSIIVELELGTAVDRFTTSDIVSGRYSWPRGTSWNDIELPLHNAEDDLFSILYETGRGSGTGEIELNFPSLNGDDNNFIITGAIRDRVGPAILEATCFQQDPDRDFDTLLVLTTEALRGEFEESKRYLRVFGDAHPEEGSDIRVASVDASSGYRFLLPKNSITYGDSVNFVYDTGIKDEVGNSPHPNNRRVEVDVKGGVLPHSLKALIFDTRGEGGRRNGDGDSIFVSFEITDDPNALTLDSIQSVRYRWNSDEFKRLNPSDLKFEGENTFSFVDESLSGGSGLGEVELHFRRKDGVDRKVSVSIDDRIAPVLTSATYSRWDSRDDTLRVTFSEEIKGNPSGRLLSNGRDDIRINYEGRDGDIFIFSTSSTLRDGDSIFIKGGAAIEDIYDNRQIDDENRRVGFSDYKRAVILETVRYADLSEPRNGYIDRIDLHFSGTIPHTIERSVVREMLNLPEERDFTITSVERRDNRRIRLSVEQFKDMDRDSRPAPSTAISDYDRVSIKSREHGGVVVESTIFASDRSVQPDDELAPVIVSASVRLDRVQSEGVDLIDTLVVVYSERVKRHRETEPFRIESGSNNERYSLHVEGSLDGGDTLLYPYVYRMDRSPATGDMIQLDWDSRLEDHSGFVQNSRTEWVPLTVERGQPDFRLQIADNPYDMSRFHDGDYFARVRISPRTRRLPDDIEAEFVMLDQVGNVVMSVSRSQFGELEDGVLEYLFRPQNRAGRPLGGGTYYLVVSIIADGSRTVHREAFGIKAPVPGSEQEE